jgi:hypothetical protein
LISSAIIVEFLTVTSLIDIGPLSECRIPTLMVSWRSLMDNRNRENTEQQNEQPLRHFAPT